MKFDFKIKPEIIEALYEIVPIKEADMQYLWIKLIRSSEIISHYSCPAWFQMLWEKTDSLLIERENVIVLGEEILKDNNVLSKVIDIIYDKTYKTLNESLWTTYIKGEIISSQTIDSFHRMILRMNCNYTELFEYLCAIKQLDKVVFMQEIRNIAMGKP